MGLAALEFLHQRSLQSAIRRRHYYALKESKGSGGRSRQGWDGG